MYSMDRGCCGVGVGVAVAVLVGVGVRVVVGATDGMGEGGGVTVGVEVGQVVGEGDGDVAALPWDEVGEEAITLVRAIDSVLSIAWRAPQADKARSPVMKKIALSMPTCPIALIHDPAH
jgi:hypothetical protein